MLKEAARPIPRAWGLVAEGESAAPFDPTAIIEDFRAYLNALKKSPRTVYGYADDLRRWFMWWPHPVGAFDVKDWDRWTFWMSEKGLTGKTIRRYQSSMRRFYKFLRRKGIVTHDPARDSESVGIEKRLPTFLTEDEVARMMTKPRSPRTRAFMELLYSCGLRNGEVRGLKLSDIIGDRLRVLGKGSKERIVPLSSSASSALKAYIAVRPESGSPLVFVTISGTKVHHQQIKEMVTRLAAAAGIKRRITPHTLRHSIATHMLNRGMDLRYVAEFLGHGDLSTTMIYTHIATEQLNQKVHQFHPDFAAKGDA